MSDRLSYEVVGGGAAGMTTALYTTRLGHRTAVFEAAGDEIEEDEVPAAATDLRAKMRLVRNRDAHAGLRGPPPDR